ncbi:SLAIN motif-containing protein 2-like isoform X1 [Crassostrea angulata]|uniref:SLAIN motif-containing protein 2-like isoform X1 n=1 Tax=Magallana angulata TaxID=2784310 RepID=UPI0022B1FDF6|nr:SLAIN motif-containing protein 2-like isoform X1 [Crassostrea angulata]
MDATDTIIDPQAEVKKLQDLVKKLEKQNEFLRGRQKIQLETLQNGETEPGKLTANHNNNLPSSNDKTWSKNIGGDSLEDIDVLDVDGLSLRDDEDSWLFMSPKPPTPQQNKISPYKWVRQEFDHPSPEVNSVKKSLLNKLDEVARISRSSSTPTFGLYSSSSSSRPRMSQSAENTPVSNQTPAVRKSLYSNAGGSSSRINTGTFTRPKTKIQTESGDKAAEGADKHPDVTDIENLAKQQEESLRQSMTNSSPRRVIRPRQIPQQGVQALNNINNNIEVENTGSPIHSNRSSPSRVEGDRRNSQTNSIGSDASSPPDSPYGSQYLNPPTENTNLRRSLPNVSQRLTQPQGHHASDPYLDNYSSGGSDDYEVSPTPAQQRQFSRLQPPVRPTSPNVSGLRQPSSPMHRGLSPQRTGLPQPMRRSIPRPDSAVKSSIPSPRRSALPSPRRTNQYRAQGSDESWKEGCF